jgi:hypothetical protein
MSSLAGFLSEPPAVLKPRNMHNTVLNNKGNIKSSSWNTETLFSESNKTLQDMMGILLMVPELRDNLKDVTGGELPDGQKLALIIKDWVNGEAVNDIATNYFMDDSNNSTKAMTKCGQNLFGKLTHTASWGLGALLSITAGDLPEEEFKELSNLPSRVYYGVNNDSAIALRLLGIPRTAAMPMAIAMANVMDQPLPKIREILSSLPANKWEQTLGEQSGKVYRKVWRVLEGLE